MIISFARSNSKGHTKHDLLFWYLLALFRGVLKFKVKILLYDWHTFKREVSAKFKFWKVISDRRWNKVSFTDYKWETLSEKYLFFLIKITSWHHQDWLTAEPGVLFLKLLHRKLTKLHFVRNRLNLKSSSAFWRLKITSKGKTVFNIFTIVFYGLEFEK